MSVVKTLNFYDLNTFKLQIASDLHLEMYHNPEVLQKRLSKMLTPSADFLALLGDIGDPLLSSYELFLKTISPKFQHIFVVAGNHEYYRNSTIYNIPKTFESTNDHLEQICSNIQTKNVTFLNQNIIDIVTKTKKIRVLGTTLWSEIPTSVESTVQKRMNDYRKIYVSETETITPHFVQGLFQENVKWIQKQIVTANKNGGKSKSKNQGKNKNKNKNRKKKNQKIQKKVNKKKTNKYKINQMNNKQTEKQVKIKNENEKGGGGKLGGVVVAEETEETDTEDTENTSDTYELEKNEEIKKQNDDEKTSVVVLTHHAPSFKGTVSPKMKGLPISHAYASNLESLFCRPKNILKRFGKNTNIKIWASGHTHHNYQKKIYGTKILSNSKGYPWQTTGFDPRFLVKF
ncbi:ser/thr protein phosphatase superfamily [Anaeramoeba flamelloides]|uniref:Ser/thr protein phosphatase superfamily n=1 Tax=Anaeramoeba flamelloides TaxID=1746091 RepID=A0ABQ8YDQ0_9EUKA|nr:ser/thr protein phosphatase superfamily [Anaeramoeba flamelloides]